MTSLFDEPVSALLDRLAPYAPADNVAASIRAAYLFEANPWKGKKLREAAAEFDLGPLPVLKRVESADGTTKFLLGLRDGKAPFDSPSGLAQDKSGRAGPGFGRELPRPDLVECVLIPAVRGGMSRDKMSARHTKDGAPSERRPTAAACVSSQVGCAAGCSFCASGLGGLSRNLTAGEIVLQALQLKREAASRGFRLATLVFMGMGEPLHNTENVIRAIGNLTHRAGGTFPPGGITVSTVGILPGMRELALSKPAPHLAVSLHAPDDATRASIVRTAPKLWTVEETLDAAAEYRATAKRHVTLSYVLLDGVNDRPDQAELFAKRLAGRKFHVNLIPHNPVEGLPWRASPHEKAYRFWTILREHGVVVHFRKQRGSEEDAACGQLRRRVETSF